MQRVMHRLVWAWDFDREEDWLNAWAARGLALVDVCGIRYVFEEGAPGEYEYRLELLEHTAGSSEGRCYLDFLRDLDIECVGTYGRWAYLRRPRDGAPFDLFSDIDSKIAHLRRIEVLVLAVLLVQVTTAASLLHRGSFLPEMLPIAVLWAAIMILMACGFVRIARKLRRLKRERAVRE